LLNTNFISRDQFMEDKNFEDLIEELRTLKIREIEIVAELKRAVSTAQTDTNEREDTRDTEQATARNGVKRGDRVRITNKIRRPASAGPAWTEAKERLATVTSVTPTQVHILTDNGTRTWRGPNNLRAVQKQG
jgi:hypothetical protein